jgi:hypothetical protein
MKGRAERTRRVLALQEQLHRVQHWKLINLERQAAELDAQRIELIAALNGCDALQDLLLDATVRRLIAIAKAADAVARQEMEQAARVGEEARRVACALRLSHRADREAVRADEKRALIDIIDRLMGSSCGGTTPASRKIAAS